MSNYNFRDYDVEELVTFEILADSYATMISCGFSEFQASQKFLNFERFDSTIYYDYIRRRDCYFCQKCGKPQSEELMDIGRKLSIHHKDSDHSNDSQENLITYCGSCHQKVERRITKVKNEAKKDAADLEIMCETAGI